MQAKLCTRSMSLFVENGQACGARAPPLQHPFRCPRCGEHERFRSLAALRAHLEYSHTYHTRLDLSLPNTRGQSHCNISPPTHRSTQETEETAVRDSASVETQAMPDTSVNNTHTGRGGELSDPMPSASTDPDPPPDQLSDQGMESILATPDGGLHGAEAGIAGPCCAPVGMVGQRLEGMLQAADSSMERRLLRLSSELAQTDTAILCERAHSHHLAHQRREVQERERALSRQVDAAVTVIATLRQQLSMSEYELERSEQEVSTIKNFLEAAAQHEMCGKVRLRRFIENLLRRIALAEKLLEYYQSAPHRQHCPNHFVTSPSGNGPFKLSKSRSSGDTLLNQEDQPHTCYSGLGFPRQPRERHGHPSTHEEWNPQWRSDGYEV